MGRPPICIRAGPIALVKHAGSRMEAVMDGAIVTFLNIASLTALVVLFFIVLDIPVARHPKTEARHSKTNASANSHTHQK